MGAASASRKTWNWRAKLAREKTKPGRTCSCLALETRLEFHPASEGIEVHVNQGEVYICKDGVVTSDSNLHVSSAKLFGISQEALVQSTSESVNSLAAITKFLPKTA